MSDARLDPVPPAHLRFVSQAGLRYSDVDWQGHVNNAVYAALFEQGRATFLTGLPTPPLAADRAVVLASLTIEFRRELHWPGTVDLRVGVRRIGRCSYALAQQMLQGDAVIADADCAQVLISRETRRAVPLSEAQRAALIPWILE